MLESMSRHHRRIAAGAIVAVTMIPVLAALPAWARADQAPPAPRVRFATFEPVSLSLREEYAGRARGSRELDVRARVEGILEQRLYTEGQRVDVGDVLFLLDAKPYEIALQQAEAEQANAKARLRQAQREWHRVSGLFKQKAVSERERDEAQSQFELAEAGLAITEAGVASARLNLDWTRVSAPIAGGTGMEILSEGSLISRGDLLTTMTQTDPIQVRFALPERDAALQATVRRARLHGEGQEEMRQRSVTLILPDGSDYAHTGVIDFTDTSIDPRTGSVSARAVFPNPDGRIMPGQFVRLRLITQELDAVMLVPEVAVGQDQEGARVLIIGADDQVELRRVVLGPVVDQGQVITAGIESGERVVVRGLHMLQEGQRVHALPLDDSLADGAR